MAVIISEFEAVADNSAEQRGDVAPRKPTKVRGRDLESPLLTLALRASRIRAH